MTKYAPKASAVLRYIFSILTCFLIILSAHAQEEGRHHTVLGSKLHYGFIIPHSPDLRPISNTNPWGIQFDWSRLSTTRQAWEHCNCYAKVGLSFTYFNYSWPDVLGSSYSVIGFGEPFLLYRPRFSLSLRTGLGVSFLDQVYDESTNPQNIFYSSPISFLLLANLEFVYRLSPYWSISLSANYNHISNGGISSPNLGMNYPTLSLGAEYRLEEVSLIPREKVDFDRWKIRPYGRFFLTRRGVEKTSVADRKNVLLLGLAGGVQTQVTKLHAISTGPELFRDEVLAIVGRRRDIDKEPWVVGWSLAHHFTFGKFDFNQQLVYYLYKPFAFNDNLFYQRYEMMYYFTSKLQGGISLLAHGDTAQNIDVRIGFVF